VDDHSGTEMDQIWVCRRLFGQCRTLATIYDGPRLGWFKYVKYSDIEIFHRVGWMVVADLGLPHSEYSVLMWHCDCTEGDGYDGLLA